MLGTWPGSVWNWRTISLRVCSEVPAFNLNSEQCRIIGTPLLAPRHRGARVSRRSHPAVSRLYLLSKQCMVTCLTSNAGWEPHDDRRVGVEQVPALQFMAANHRNDALALGRICAEWPTTTGARSGCGLRTARSASQRRPPLRCSGPRYSSQSRAEGPPCPLRRWRSDVDPGDTARQFR
jgi:hypothetical protein